MVDEPKLLSFHQGGKLFSRMKSLAGTYVSWPKSIHGEDCEIVMPEVSGSAILSSSKITFQTVGKTSSRVCGVNILITVKGHSKWIEAICTSEVCSPVSKARVIENTLSCACEN